MDPELIEALINEILFAQQDVTRAENRRPAPETGSMADFLRALGGLGLDFTPGVGDVKAVAFDAPRQFEEGENLAGLLSILSAIPGVGFLGDLLRGGKRAVDVRGAQAFENLIERQGASPESALRGKTTSGTRGERAVSDILGETGGEPGEEAFTLLIERLGGKGGTQGKR